MKFRILLLLFLMLLTRACFDTSLEFEDQYKVVLEAYLYKDRDINNVKLSSMISFGDDTTGGSALSDALVTLEREGEFWQLLENDSVPGTYYMGEELAMEPGDSFNISVTMNDEVISAATLMPDNPPSVSLSASSIGIPKVYDMRDFNQLEMPDPLELTWENPELDYYFFRIQNIETYVDLIIPEPPDGAPSRGGFNFQMDTRPTNDNYSTISFQELTHFGTHRIIVYSVNNEYVQLYNSLDQDSRELNEPYSNVNNGLGIFTAFNSDTLYFEVYPVY